MSCAQTAQDLANTELRTFFANVTNPTPSVKFLYDMSAHIADSSFFGHLVYDTSNLGNWFNIYHEMYYGAYDTSLFLKDDTVVSHAQPYINNDTIPMGIIDWDYNLLNQSALTTGNYFSFDTVNNLIFDLPSPVGSPYLQETVFAGTALREDFGFGNPVFRVDPQFIFKDSSKLFDSEHLTLKIDFDDSTGWHNFNGNIVEYYQASYSVDGPKLIKFGIFNTSGSMIRYSHSTFKITSATVPVEPTSVAYYPGMKVSFYEPTCTVSTDKKYVIYLEGIDVLNNRHANEIYQYMIKNTEMAQLRNFGYTFVVVDYNDTYLPLKTNAMFVVNLIDQLKCINGRDKIPPPFVVIGESMSALIARYALCYMETPAYYKDGSKCQPSYKHNTRLMITIDGPNQGANIPMADQYLYKYISTLAIPFNAVTRGAFNRYWNLLNGSAGEMLINHISTDSYPLLPISSSTFGPSVARMNFVNDLLAIGNYPQFCKKVALSNGSAEGHNQIRSWDNQARVQNDTILALNAEIYLRILGIRILGSTHTLTMNTAPLGTNHLFRATAGVSHWKIKLKWFGLKLVWGTTYYVNIDKSGINMQPIDVSAGSYVVSNLPFTSSSSFNFFDVFGFGVGSTGGTLTATGHLGIPWFANLNLNFGAYSDGI
ncbi:MAG: hypothetical protein ABI169_14005, partial [Chitinophagaceae bacterium]